MSDIEDANRKRLLNIIKQIPSGVPDGWEKISFAVGGLRYIGFSNVRTEKLIVISSQGQSVINRRTGEKTYCEDRAFGFSRCGNHNRNLRRCDLWT